MCFTRVCLSVCLLAALGKNAHRIFGKILREMYLWARKNSKFWQSSASASGSRNLWRIFKHCKIGHFPPFGWYLWKKWLDVHEFFSELYLWTRKSPLIFGSHPDSSSALVSIWFCLDSSSSSASRIVALHLSSVINRTICGGTSTLFIPVHNRTGANLNEPPPILVRPTTNIRYLFLFLHSFSFNSKSIELLTGSGEVIQRWCHRFESGRSVELLALFVLFHCSCPFLCCMVCYEKNKDRYSLALLTAIVLKIHLCGPLHLHRPLYLHGAPSLTCGFFTPLWGLTLPYWAISSPRGSPRSGSSARSVPAVVNNNKNNSTWSRAAATAGSDAENGANDQADKRSNDNNNNVNISSGEFRTISLGIHSELAKLRTAVATRYKQVQLAQKPLDKDAALEIARQISNLSPERLFVTAGNNGAHMCVVKSPTALVSRGSYF